MTDVGNFEFVQGDWDDWEYKIHWMEHKHCPECDCYCTTVNGATEVRKCVPELLYITIENVFGCDHGGGIDGTYEMRQSRVLAYDIIDGVDLTYPWPTKFQWVSEAVSCPDGGTSHVLQFVLECVSALYDETLSYPAFRLWLARYGVGGAAYNCSTISFAAGDAATLLVDDGSNDTPPNTMAFCLPTSTCSPFYLEFPDLFEDNFECNGASTNACCGGYVESSDPPFNSPAAQFRVTITE